jgi:hypothetical protein
MRPIFQNDSFNLLEIHSLFSGSFRKSLKKNTKIKPKLEKKVYFTLIFYFKFNENINKIKQFNFLKR